MDRQTRIPAGVEERLRRKDATTRIAVVGASNNPEKYGNVIVRNLHGKGYAVLPVNPREPEIAGLAAYRDVASVPRPVHVVDFVTPPGVTLEVLRGLDPSSVGAVWLQDGSFDDAVVACAEERFATVVRDACIMVVTGRL
ncbi:MAG: CoA-binding protein [Deltaproteobacteria bacterium]|nr:CoA-binding protein [Deltaproteobacteria bacterium]